MGRFRLKPPAFQFYADDFIGGTCDLSTQDVGSYIRLLCYQWSRGEIPLNDPAKLARIAGTEVSGDVLSKFPFGKNNRMEAERQKQADYRALQSEKGKASAKARFNRGSTGVPTERQPDTQPKCNSPSPSPSSDNNTLGAVAPHTNKSNATKTQIQEPDAAWLASLKTNPAYENLNIGLEFGKMQAWCGANRKTPSRRRFINWLNRAERPMPRQIVIPSVNQSEAINDGPSMWRETLHALFPENTYEGPFHNLPESIRAEILRAG